jgi:hypothetical protein
VDRDCDHGEIYAGPPEGDETDQKADETRRDRADEQRRYHVRKTLDRQQIGGHHAARAEEGGLAEREQAGDAEQDVETDAKQTPHENAVDRGWRKAEVRQDERRGDQPR